MPIRFRRAEFERARGGRRKEGGAVEEGFGTLCYQRWSRFAAEEVCRK